MSEMIERLVKAAILEEYGLSDQKTEAEIERHVGDKFQNESVRRYWKDAARIALRVLREPTEKMMERAAYASELVLPEYVTEDVHRLLLEQMKIAWQAAIDEALQMPVAPA